MAQQVKDVVCGMMVDPDTAAAKVTYQGKTYYFCAPGCKAAFERDPQKYLNQENEEGHHHEAHHAHH
jgi:YHS domain-containing protein